MKKIKLARPNERKPLVTGIFTADPSAHVFNGKIYIYPSHDFAHDCPDDDNGDQYIMQDYHVLSMDSLDSECIDNGLALSEDDVPWVKNQMWAPDCVYKNGKYYLVFPAKDYEGQFHIGVAVSDSPVGPFVPQETCIPGSYSIDPAVLVDDDGRTYCYYGGLWGGQLEMWQSGSFDPNAHRPEGDEPALGPMFAEFNDDMDAFITEPKHLQIIDENGDPILLSAAEGAVHGAGGADGRFRPEPHIICATQRARSRTVPSPTRDALWSPFSDGRPIIPSLKSTVSGISSTMTANCPEESPMSAA